MKFAVLLVSHLVLAVLAYLLSFLMVWAMVLTQWVCAAADRADMKFTLARAEARTRRERQQLKGQRR